MQGKETKSGRKTLVLSGYPQKKQLEFFRADKKYIAYGGARGGGKSWALRRKLLLLAMNYPGISILLIRRTLQELRDNHIRPMTGELTGFCNYSEMKKTFEFPNSSRIRLGYLDGDGDLLQYQGQEYDIIAIDEATQITEYQFQTLKASLRGANDFPKRMYLTCNPGGVGHGWVKRLFVTGSLEKARDPRSISLFRRLFMTTSFYLRKIPTISSSYAVFRGL